MAVRVLCFVGLLHSLRVVHTRVQEYLALGRGQSLMREVCQTWVYASTPGCTLPPIAPDERNRICLTISLASSTRSALSTPGYPATSVEDVAESEVFKSQFQPVSAGFGAVATCCTPGGDDSLLHSLRAVHTRVQFAVNKRPSVSI